VWAGKEAVQFYVSAPGRDMDKPAMELVTFGKTRLLEPGESEILNFQIDTKDIASFDESSSSWVAEQGTYTLSVGSLLYRYPSYRRVHTSKITKCR
jgi:beta-glucosidase